MTRKPEEPRKTSSSFRGIGFVIRLVYMSSQRLPGWQRAEQWLVGLLRIAARPGVQPEPELFRGLFGSQVLAESIVAAWPFVRALSVLRAQQQDRDPAEDLAEATLQEGTDASVLFALDGDAMRLWGEYADYEINRAAKITNEGPDDALVRLYEELRERQGGRPLHGAYVPRGSSQNLRAYAKTIARTRLADALQRAMLESLLRSAGDPDKSDNDASTEAWKTSGAGQHGPRRAELDWEQVETIDIDWPESISPRTLRRYLASTKGDDKDLLDRISSEYSNRRKRQRHQKEGHLTIRAAARAMKMPDSTLRATIKRMEKAEIFVGTREDSAVQLSPEDLIAIRDFRSGDKKKKR